MPTPEQLKRLAAVVPMAQLTQRRWHIPASVTLAQWIFESSWGTSKLATQGNNFFGVKATGSQPYVEMRTAEYAPGAKDPHTEAARFASYSAATDSFEAHGRLLGGSSRYAAAIAVADDVPAFCRQLQMCGYSTNPKYAKMLCDQIDALDLTQYDTPAAPLGRA